MVAGRPNLKLYESPIVQDFNMYFHHKLIFLLCIDKFPAISVNDLLNASSSNIYGEEGKRDDLG